MKKFFKILLLCIFGIVFVGTLVYLFKKSRPEEVEYSTFRATIADVENKTIITGNIEPRDEVQIKPRISGIITQLLKQAGDYVHAGDVIAKVKVVPDMQVLSTTSNRVSLAKIDLNLAQTEFERAQQLYDDHLISTEEYQKEQKSFLQAKAQLVSANDDYEIAKNGVSKSQANLSNTLVKSTLDGIILDVPVKVGSSVIMSNTFNDGTTIASVANMKDLIFRGVIDETQVGYLYKGMPINITIGALEGERFPAHLDFISPKNIEVKNGANQYEVKASLKLEKNVEIRAGYSANASIILQSAKHVLTVPEAALMYENNKPYVFLLIGEHPQKFEKRWLTTGLSDGLNIEVKSGLKVGDKVRGPLKQKEGEVKIEFKTKKS